MSQSRVTPVGDPALHSQALQPPGTALGPGLLSAQPGPTKVPPPWDPALSDRDGGGGAALCFPLRSPHVSPALGEGLSLANAQL